MICAAVAAYYGRAFGRITPEQAREVATHAQVCAHEVAQIVRGEVAKP